ncbi:hypothetical protein BsWGS_04595 [Bradybaena similaris]
MLTVPGKARISNQHTLKETKTQRLLTANIRKRQSSCFGHIMRSKKPEHVTTGQIFRGRHRKILDSYLSWHGGVSGKSVDTCCWKSWVVDQADILIIHGSWQGTW